MAWLLFVSLVVLCIELATPRQEGVPEEWAWQSYPHPMVDTEGCGRRDQPSLICDPNLILEYEQASDIDRLLRSIRTDTRCPCSQFYCSQNPKGYRVAVAIVKKMKPHSQHKNGATTRAVVYDHLQMARQFTVGLESSQWKSGQCNEDVLVFFSLIDNVMYVMTGEKAREKLTDSIISDIIMDNRRHLSPGKDINKGITNVITEIKRVFIGTYKQTPRPVPVEPAYKAVIGRSSAAHSFPLVALYASVVLIHAITK